MIQGSFVSNRWFLVASLWVLAGVVGMVFPSFFPLYLLSGVLLLILVMWDYKTLSREAGVSIQVRLPVAMELGRIYRVRIRLLDEEALQTSEAHRMFAPHMELFEHVDASSSYLLSRKSSEWVIRPIRLGYTELEASSVLVSSQFGFWNRIIELSYDRSYTVKVLPLQKQIDEAQVATLLSRQKLMMMGERVLVRGISNDQFHSVRPYRYPDPVRYIDHRKTAKFQELMTRQYDSLQSHHLCIALDLGRGMCGFIDRSHKEDFYLAVAYSLAEYAIRRGDRVTVIGFSDHIHFCIAGKTNLESFRMLYLGTPETRAQDKRSDYTILERAIMRSCSRHSLLVILSEVLRPAGVSALTPSLSRLTMKHLVVLLSLLPTHLSLEESLALSDNYDLNDEAFAYLLYLHQLHQQKQAIGDTLLRAGVPVIHVNQNYWMTAALKIYQRMRRLAA